jgi:acyl-CoA synthetase (AMP-forming)/AMP-acid ligase II
MSSSAQTPSAPDWVEVCTIGDLLVRAARLWPDKDWMIFQEGPRATYGEMLERAERAARSLLGLGIESGERVGILMPNCLEFLDVQYGCALLGVSAVPINARYKVAELQHVLEDGELGAIVTTDLISEYVPLPELVAEALESRPPALRHAIMLGDGPAPAGFVDAAAFAAAAEGVDVAEVHVRRRRVRLRDEAMMMYTSGTTAHPKGCVLTHEALVRTGMAAAERWETVHEDRFWDPLPMFHMSQVFPQLAHMHAGATIYTCTRFDATEAIRTFERERITYAFTTFPIITQAIIKHPDFEKADLSSIRLVNETGAAETIRDVQRRFGDHAKVVTLFGMTEGCGGITWGSPRDSEEKRITTGGLPLRGTEVRVVDEEDNDLPPGTPGEILFRGPGLFERYHNDPEKTAHAMRGGWFHTGDRGQLDEEGRLTYLGRLKDMLKVGGENVAALEIEAFLGNHPAVKIAVVVGVPDPRYDEVPAAWVELVPGASLTEEELIEYCRGKIASFKIPRYVRFTDEWPMSASKIQKFKLRERMLAELGLQPEEATETVTTG